jgi:hypothetical protein|nr:MAG TPA: hypothetical protein [Bacteriophage sp.]
MVLGSLFFGRFATLAESVALVFNDLLSTTPKKLALFFQLLSSPFSLNG